MLKSCLAILVAIIAMSVQPPQIKGATVSHGEPVKASGDSSVLAIAKEWFQRFQTGNIDRSQFDAKTNADLTEPMVRSEAATLRKFGKPYAVRFVQSGPIGNLMAYAFSFEFRTGRVIESIAFDQYGKIAGIDFQTFVAK